MKIDLSRRALVGAFWSGFLGDSPSWVKVFVVIAVVLNTTLRYAVGAHVVAWAVLVEFICCLAFSLQCYPLVSGGLIVIHGIVIGLATPEHVLEEVKLNINVLLLLVFLVSSIHFLKNVLFLLFTQLFLKVENKTVLSVLFLLVSAFVSSFLNALTVAAVIVNVFVGLLGVYFHVVKERDLPQLVDRVDPVYQMYPKIRRKTTKKSFTSVEMENMLSVRNTNHTSSFEWRSKDRHSLDPSEAPFSLPKLRTIYSQKIKTPHVPEDEELRNGRTEEHAALLHDMSRFRAFLRSLVMHAAVGTALGGNITKVGEPQNLIVADIIGWDFVTFMIKLLPVWGPTIPLGVFIVILLESWGRFGYGTNMPSSCREVLQEFAKAEYGKMATVEFANLIVQVISAAILLFGLVFQVAEVGLVGLVVIIFVTAMNGLTYESEIAVAFREAMPFTALLVVFFGVIAILEENHTFDPLIESILELDDAVQIWVMYLVNGLLSMFSDNVFVATLFIDQVESFKASSNGTLSDGQFEKLGIAIISGTNLPSMATPNGQAAFLFILTSNLAPIVNLSYRKMTLMALPYTLVMGITGLVAMFLI